MKRTEWTLTQAAWVVQSCPPLPPSPGCCSGPRLQSGQRSEALSLQQNRSGRGPWARVWSSDHTLSQSRGEDRGGFPSTWSACHPSRACSPDQHPVELRWGVSGWLACSPEVLSLQQKNNGSERVSVHNTGPARGSPPPQCGGLPADLASFERGNRPWLRGRGSQKSRCQGSSPGSTLGSCEGAVTPGRPKPLTTRRSLRLGLLAQGVGVCGDSISPSRRRTLPHQGLAGPVGP